ncbi:MAG: hypothetical protein JJ959_08850 [Nisaea sp.]|uniref:hypothetical protein n=1 Tax=Nisaea sp. TaxID=2024842 RepID=UPI001B053F68|nr:hypothetical protein [Nisaea sp.]MBO6560632.1 hypothetical protein [Nisaea sp.]
MIYYGQKGIKLCAILIAILYCAGIANAASKKNNEKYVLLNCGNEYFVDKELFVKNFNIEGPVFVNPIISTKKLEGLNRYEALKNILHGEDKFFRQWTHFGELHEQCDGSSWSIVENKKNKFKKFEKYILNNVDFSICCEILEEKDGNGSGSVYIIYNDDLIILRYRNESLYRIIFTLKLSISTNYTIEAEKGVFERVKSIEELARIFDLTRDLIDCLILEHEACDV